VGLILWGFAIVVISIAWLPRFAFLRNWPTDLSQVLLAALVIRAFRRKASGDREMAGIFAAYFVVRWQQALQIIHLPGSFLNYYISIARAAEAHGQNDDITVLTLRFAPDAETQVT
jgi:hypothetical protein